MEPVRVLNLFTNMNRGGAETMVMNYYRNLDRSKIQFDFLVHREQRGIFEDEIESLGGRIYRMPPVHPKYFSIYKNKIREFLRQHTEYKIIHGHMSELGVLVYEAAKEFGIPVRIVHAHNAKMDWDIKALFRIYFKNRMKKSISHMFTCGEEAGKWLFGRKNARDFVLMKNAIDYEKFEYNKTISEKYRKELGIHNKFVIGHIGRFNKQKNHNFLIDIFSEIVKMHNESVLILVGDGDLRLEIDKKAEKLGIKDKVKFLGVRTDTEQLINSFDIFLFPSLFEGVPVTLIEAQANGLPCIVSSGVPVECDITKLVKFIPLDMGKENWAKIVLAYKNNVKRINTKQALINSGYEIKQSANWLSDYYLNSIN